MKSTLLITLLFVAPLLANAKPDISNKTNAGFAVATAAVKDKRYNIAEHGAVGNGTTLNTKAIQAVIDDCAQNGGGTVVIPKGVFLSGSIFLKPGVNLEIQEGGVLKGSTNIEDYPKGT